MILEMAKENETPSFEKRDFKLQIQLWIENLAIQLWKNIFNAFAYYDNLQHFREEKYFRIKWTTHFENGGFRL